MLKQCLRCKEYKDLSEFHKDKSRKDNLYPYCKKCKSYLAKLKRQKHIQNKKCPNCGKSINNSYKCDKCTKYNRNYEKTTKYKNRRQKWYKTYKQNIQVHIAANLRSRLRDALKNNRKIGSAVIELGCTLDYFIKYIEEKFQPGMSWKNYGQWHLDHIIPLSNFDLTNKKQFSKACHYTNLQPLWAVDNIRKGNKTINEQTSTGYSSIQE